MSIKQLVRRYGIAVKFGLMTGAAIILFEVMNLFVLYRQVKLDYYLAIVAIIFLVAGLWIAKRPNSIDNHPAPQRPGHHLTAKELEILALIATGKANKEIAGLLFVEISTVKTHINNIYSKLAVTNRKEAKLKYAEINRNML
ncbi:MAG TPA: helix-turn-helix transcriptional regulator [Chitinophagaceae bacterium]|nr:helix-turn-helix transcriptional regulator [Chitinophagaceae bacterium]